MNNQHTSSGISHFHVQDPPHKHHPLRVCVCCARLFLSTYIETSFLLEIVYCWMIKGIEKSCLKIAQGRQEVLTGDPEGLTWDEFERRVMTWAQPKYGATYARGLWCNQLPDISWLDLKVEEDFNTFKVECKKAYEIIGS